MKMIKLKSAHRPRPSVSRTNVFMIFKLWIYSALLFSNWSINFIYNQISGLSTFNRFNVLGIFGGWGSKCDPCLHIFFVCKIHPFGRYIPVYILHMWNSSPTLASRRPSCRGTHVILISTIYGMYHYDNFATKLWKKCWKGEPFWKGTLSWNTTRGTLRVRCPCSAGARGFTHPEPIGVTPLTPPCRGVQPTLY